MKQENLLKLLRELVRNSKRSDRELAKAIKLSQPTVTRLRKLSGKYVRSYTIIPEFDKVGYEILAFTFVKARTYERKKVEERIVLVKDWYMKHPNVIFASDGEGLGKDGVIVSIHKSYSKYADFMRDYIVSFADIAGDVESFIVSLKTGIILKPFDLKYLAENMDMTE